MNLQTQQIHRPGEPRTRWPRRTLMRLLPAAIALACAGVVAQDGSPDPRVARGGPALPAGAAPAIATVFTNIAGDPSAAVPGLPGVEFQPGGGTLNFDRPAGSPNGRWILTAQTNQPVAENEVVLVDGVVVAREGTPTGVDDDNVGLIDSRVAINDDGDYAYATNTDADVAADEVIVQVIAGVPSYAAREGDPAAGIAGASYGGNLNSPVIAADGRVGFIASQLQGVPAGQAQALLLGAVPLAQTGVDIPGNQIGNEFWENFDVEDLWLSADGSSWLAQGDLAGAVATDDVVVVDGDVVVQEGVVLAGSGFAEPVAANGIVAVAMAPGGRWFVRGANAVTAVDWVYSSGRVLAAVDEPVAGGNPGELWSDDEFAACFFMHVGDSAGNYVIGGVTDGPTESNGVLVLNDEMVLVREGDPVDIDGNGLFDDDAFFNTFGNDDGVLTDDGLFYFTATLRNAGGTSFAQGFFVAETVLADRLFADGFELP